ncbi:calcium homeostasis endoplasmic reticulum protein isoform X2 [Eurosta solidaginis]|uniref:calcium homeostasis endoplasmic reticulum protein isoform X2 n=1 Tax=Eurosta solidaginis TaxID=178769 RepID=UPI0035305B65
MMDTPPPPRVLKQQSMHQQNQAIHQPPPHHMTQHHQTQPASSPAVPHHYAQAPPNQLHVPQAQGLTQNTHDANSFNMNLQQPPPSTANNSTNVAINFTGQIEAINIQQNTLREQIHQSESNLSAQHSAMMAQQAKQIEEAIEAAQNAQLEKQAEENNIVLRDFDAVLQPIIESCTKDSISGGKNWILQHSSDSAKSNVVLQYLLKKALVNGSTFQQKLHLIYLVNDILHHCVRKNSHDLKNNLENVVIPMFCSADLIATAEQRTKLTKLLSLWESKAKFFDACVISKLQSPDSSMQEYKTNLQNLHQDIVTKFAQGTKTTLDNYQKQHQIFIQHATQQITQLEQQKQQLEQQMLATVLPNAAAILPITPTKLPPQPQQQQQQQTPKIPSLMSQKISMPDSNDDDHINPPGVDDSYNNAGVNSNRSHHYQQQQPFDNNMNFGQQTAGGQQNNNFPLDNMQQHQQHAQGATGNFFIPDMSRPPPGFASGGANNIANQMPSAGMSQQFGPQLNNIPQAVNNNSGIGGGVSVGMAGGVGSSIGGGGGVSGVMGNSNGGGISGNLDTANSNVPTANIDVLALNAAIQLVLKQNQQLQGLDQIGQQQQMQLPDMQGQSLAQTQLLPHLMQDKDDDMPPAPIGFMLPQMEMQEQLPSAPYYDLPAGLMVPLIRLDDYSYKSLDPADIRLPPPAPQSERLTNALAAFYAPPTHDRPRDTEGWEKLGLYEYYKVKNAAKKQKEEEIQKGEREKTRSPSPIILEKPKKIKFNKRCYRSKSRSRSKSPHRSPPPPRANSNRRNNRHNKQRSRSPKKSPQFERLERERLERERLERERIERERIERERFEREREFSNSSRENRPDRGNPRRERSITPPSFFTGSLQKQNEFIEESNKGHQMLKKMGWIGSGAGLGPKQQGIDQPISGGEVRDRIDMYKGVGVNMNDPFENFRKNKGVAFVHRMRSRDEKS